MSRVSLILISQSPASPMEAREEVLAVPGKGLAGDRYFEGKGTFSPESPKPDYELTLIEQEKIEDFARKSGLSFSAFEARRNIVTEGVDLNSLVDREFMIGSVLIRGLRLCEPCNYLARITSRQILRGLVNKGGLRAQILTEGTIRKGDGIRTIP